MKQTLLTIRLPRELVKRAERYAEQHETSLTQLIALYLQQPVMQENLLDDAPTVRCLSSILPTDASKDEYHAYLEEKYGHSAAT